MRRAGGTTEVLTEFRGHGGRRRDLVASQIWTMAGLVLACATASGESYDPKKFTCAHRTLPFGTRLRVTDPKSRRSVVVTVNDRGPFTKGRVIDLSLAAAKELRMIGRGLMKVTAALQ